MKTLADYRKAKGLTQAGLAEATGIPLRTIQKYEGGEYAVKNMTLAFAVKIADALGIDPRELLKLETPER